MTQDRSRIGPLDAIRPANFFALRTALLPLARFTQWADGVTRAWDGGEEGLARGKALLRERLRADCERADVREALFLASPDLDAALSHWLADPASEKGARAERALVRYFSRMCGRPTPFGLFAGCSVGVVGERTRLEIGPAEGYVRHARLDNDYLTTLAETLCKAPELLGHLILRPNSSLYEGGGRLRYTEGRTLDGARTYHLVALEVTDHLKATLLRAREGATLGDLARPLAQGEVTLGEAEDFIRLLVESQVLVADLAPPVTGPEPVHDLVRQLVSLPSGAALGRTLQEVQRGLESLDALPLGIPADRYRTLAAALEALPATVRLAHLFQVDMVKPAPGAVLGQDVLREVAVAVDLLHRLPLERGKDPLESFRDAFVNRYEGEEVPLVQALDEESGIGFGTMGARRTEGSPLLEGVVFPGEAGAETRPGWTPWDGFLLGKVLEARDLGRDSIRLDLAELGPFLGHPKRPLPGSFSVMARLAAEDRNAVDQGRFKVVFQGANGPSGASLLGRFCHGDESLARLVRQHVGEEEALRPGAIFAEVVHLPEGRVGNVILRPLLRAYEIPFLGRSGAPEERQIPVDDLRVSVKEGRVVLRSNRLGREILPRLTNAHNFHTRSLGVYRFLCSLQSQGVAAGLGWNWGCLEHFPFLPRVEAGRTILARARWRVDKAALAPIVQGEGLDRYRRLDLFRERARIPRHVLLVDGDNKLPVDFENVLSVDGFIEFARKAGNLLLEEFQPGPGEQGATGPEGSFAHELVIPFIHGAAQAREAGPRTPGRTQTERVFPPGSEWLYLKLYSGVASADQFLRETVAAIVRDALARGLADRWFFIRYGDPDWHVRLRFHGDPARLLGELHPSIALALKPLLAQGRIRKVQIDTYERELERYGEGRAMRLAEDLFQMDSAAALGILASYPGDEGADTRWRLALLGMDLLLEDAGLDLERKGSLLATIAGAFRAEFRFQDGAERQLGDRFRRERKALEELLGAGEAPDPALAEGVRILKERSEKMRPLLQELRADPGLRPGVWEARLGSHMHMSVNRLLRSAHREHELVIYDFLNRLYGSRLARHARSGAAPMA